MAVGTKSFKVQSSNASAISLSTMICRLVKQLPSLISKNANEPAPAVRPVLTHPPMRKERPIRETPPLSDSKIVLIMVRPYDLEYGATKPASSSLVLSFVCMDGNVKVF